MIRINLLPVKRKKKAQPIPPVLLQGGAILILTVVVVVFFSFRLYGKVSEMQDLKVTKEQKLAGLKEQLKEVENFEKDNEAYKVKNQIILELQKKQKAPLRLLDEISARISKGVWLTSMDDSKGAVYVSGFAFSNSELVSYVQNLKQSEFLTDVALIESRQKKMGDVTLYNFKISLKVEI